MGEVVECLVGVRGHSGWSGREMRRVLDGYGSEPLVAVSMHLVIQSIELVEELLVRLLREARMCRSRWRGE